jgi:formylglycine-generating enzyme required for sulfatase activity
VTLGAFYLATTDATFEEWQAVQKWATTHGYTDLAGVGRGKNSDHPVVDVSWYDTVKWCNAKSEMEGLAPCYYTDNAQTTVYRTGEINITNAQVRWLGSGYRLPTEAEWEYAARGKLVGNRFPWGNTITQSQANYYSWPSTTMPYDLSTSGTYHPLYFVGTHPYTSPVRAFAPNLFSLYDMAGNVAQWCWDRDGAYPSSPQTAPKGADSGSSNRVFRGGSYASFSDAMRVAKRFSVSPNSSSLFMGFRWARSWTP